VEGGDRRFGWWRWRFFFCAGCFLRRGPDGRIEKKWDVEADGGTGGQHEEGRRRRGRPGGGVVVPAVVRGPNDLTNFYRKFILFSGVEI
jgi:hypothetical protein